MEPKADSRSQLSRKRVDMAILGAVPFFFSRLIFQLANLTWTILAPVFVGSAGGLSQDEIACGPNRFVREFGPVFWTAFRSPLCG